MNTAKPPYHFSSMSEIADIPWNGLSVVSTFSGCGGSCLGYRMAGFKVLWANEFVPAAQASYRANSDSILDGRDIRSVQPEEILKATGKKIGEIDILDGSPPCQAFSTAGKREKGWGKGKMYEHGAVQKNEELFTEYIRILRGLQPKVFVAENVSGLLKGTAKGFFLEILRELKACGYTVACQLLDAQWLGVPQQRQRAIFIGVRNDLKKVPVFPKPLSYRYSVSDALPEIVTIVPGSFGNTVTHYVEMMVGNEKFGKPTWGSLDHPSASILTSAHSVSGEIRNLATAERRKFTIAELKRICAFPDDFILMGSYAQQWERLGNSVPPVMMYHIAKTIAEHIFRQ